MRPLSPQDRLKLESSLYKRSFEDFVRAAWSYVCSEPMVTELPQKVIALHLQAIQDGKFPDVHTLTISLPPGQSKSLTTSVLYPAWVWASKPSTSFICVTHGQTLTQRFATRFRALIESPWYQAHFDLKFTEDTNNKSAMRNTNMGERLVATPSSATGNHADVHIVDDLVDASEADNPDALQAANDWYDQVLSTRAKDANKLSSIVIAQRLACNDIIGHLESRPTTIKLSLPAVLDGAPCETPAWTDPRQPGELLAPIRLPQAVLDSRKIALGSHHFESQYQQRPVARTGGIVQATWLQHQYDTLPKFDKTALVIDCANTGLDDPTCILVVGVKGPKLYLMDCLTKRMDFPTLIASINQYRTTYNPTEILIEAASSGHAAIQTLRQSFSNVIDLKPLGSKTERLSSATPSLESGSVLFPPQGAWVKDFQEEVTAFPYAKHDERVDCLSYAVNRFLTSGPSTLAMLMGYAAAAKRM